MSKIDFSAVVTRDKKGAQARAEARQLARAEAAAFLAQTDWMVVRQVETGQAVPEDIRTRRAQARGLLSGD